MAKCRAKWSEKSWERQENESEQAFEAFVVYRDMGPGRSITKVEQALNKARPLIGRWSSKWNWRERCRDYDNELQRQELAEKRKAIRQMQQRQIQTAVLLQEKAEQALQQLKIESISPKDILRFITEGAKLEKEIRQDSFSVLEHEENGGSSGALADVIVAAYRKRMVDDHADP